MNKSPNADMERSLGLIKCHSFLGYSCYVDLTNNRQTKLDFVKEKKSIDSLLPKIEVLSDKILFALSKYEVEIAPRLGVQGISEKTLQSLFEHELQKRANERDRNLKNQELEIKKKANRLKYWGIAFTLINGLVLVFYKNWPG